MNNRLKVCLVLEGTYPFIVGGVSSWVHDMIKGLPDIDFVLLTILPEDYTKTHYELPKNVVAMEKIIFNEKPKNGRKIKKPGNLLKIIRNFHKTKPVNKADQIEDVLKNIQEGFFLHEASVKSALGWEMIQSANQSKNPIFPFSDYYWAWKSTHDLLFTILGSTIPEADIYHSVSTGFAGILSLSAKLRFKKPFLLTEHGLYHKEREMEIRKTHAIRGYQRDMWINFYNRISEICYRSADRITSLFEINRQKQLELGAPADKAYVIPNGIDIDRFKVKRTPREGFHVGLVGRVVPIKDIKTYIAMSKIILEAIPEATIYCIGPTDENPEYYQSCVDLVKSMKIEDRFLFTGRQNVLEYYSFLDVVVLTSVREAQPLVILEAYAAGVPVVSTNVGNVAELLDFDNRFLAPSRDADKLAEGILFIRQHPEEMRIINKKNHLMVKKYYDKIDLHKKYGDLYTDMTKKGS